MGMQTQMGIEKRMRMGLGMGTGMRMLYFPVQSTAHPMTGTRRSALIPAPRAVWVELLALANLPIALEHPHFSASLSVPSCSHPSPPSASTTGVPLHCL